MIGTREARGFAREPKDRVLRSEKNQINIKGKIDLILKKKCSDTYMGQELVHQGLVSRYPLLVDLEVYGASHGPESRVVPKMELRHLELNEQHR